ncbi:hypothetical protein M445_05515 [Vibrio owensii 47666-1]|nr:TadE family protein [Vibrio owensii]KIF48799.1 hypothetical protein M445_05515 [Vibrio owensii 47666-1]
MTRVINLKKQKGVASIEFALGFFLFWLCCVAWIEVNYLSYVSSAVDMTISRASREAKKSNGNYLNVVKQVVDDESERWGGLIDAEKFKGTINYIKSRDQLGTSSCDLDSSSNWKECGNPTNSSLALYTMSYDFSPIFTHFVGSLDRLLQREIIIVQEHERDQFEI